MDKLNNVFKPKFLKNLSKIIKENSTRDNLIIVGLIIYISVLSIYTRRNIVSLVNHPISKLIILAGILYYGKNNLALGLTMSIALLVTINLDNSLAIAESKLSKIKEGFESDEHYPPGSKDVLKTQSNDAKESDDSDSEDESDDDSDDSDDDSDSDSGEDSDEDDSDSDSDEEAAEKFYDDTEGFDINKLKPSKNLDDGFKKLHRAIHELEGFVSTKKAKK